MLISDQSSNDRKPSHMGAAVSHNHDHSQGQGQEDSAMHRPKQQQPMRSLDSADRRDDNKVMSCDVMSYDVM